MASKPEWVKVSYREFLADIERAKREARAGVHRFHTLRCMPWPVCIRCGLVLLRNKATEKARKAGCFE